MQVTTIGLDLAKNIFQVHGVTENGEVAFNQALRRAQLLAFFENLPPWWCQTNANQSLFAARCQNLCRTKLAPLGESGTSVDLEIGA